MTSLPELSKFGIGFCKDEIRTTAEEILHSRLQNWEYSAEEASQLAQELANEVRKSLQLSPRYKYTVQTWIASNPLTHGIKIATRKLWDRNVDSLVQISYSRATFHCLVEINVIFIY